MAETWDMNPLTFPVEFTILELAQKVIQLTGSKSRIYDKPVPHDDPQQSMPDISLTKKLLDWGKPRCHWKKG